MFRHMERPWIHVRTLNRSSDRASTSSDVFLVVQLPPFFWDSWRRVIAQKNRDPVVHLAAYCENHAKQLLINVMQVVHTVTTALLTVLPQLRHGFSPLCLGFNPSLCQEIFVVDKVAMQQAFLRVPSLLPR